MKIILFIILIVPYISSLKAQVGIGTLNPKSILDIQSLNSGVLIPRMKGDDILNISLDSEHEGMLLFATEPSKNLIISSKRLLVF